MQLRQVLSTVRANWIAVVAILAACLAAAAAVSMTLPPRYSTETKILVKADVPASASSAIGQVAQLVAAQLPTYAALVSTPAVLDPAAEALGGGVDPVALADDVSASVELNTTIVVVTTTADTPAGAARLANAVGASLIDQLQASGTGDAGVTGEVVEAPLVPSTPSTPGLLLILLVGLAVGIAVSFAYIVVREALRLPASEAQAAPPVEESKAQEPVASAAEEQPARAPEPLIAEPAAL